MVITSPVRIVSAIALLLVGSVLVSTPGWGQWQTRLIKDMKPGPDGAVLQRIETGTSLAYFIADVPSFQDYRLYRTDGGSAGTYELCPAYYYYRGGPAPLLATIGDRAVFVRNDADALQLWQSDGTVAGTKMVKDLAVSSTDTLNGPTNFISTGNRVFFTLGQGLMYCTNGTTSGTVFVKDFYAEYGITDIGGLPSGFTKKFCLYNGDLCFLAGNIYQEVDVWCSDGTPGGTRPVWQPGPSADYEITGLWSMPDGLYVADNHNYFDAALSIFTYTKELWRISTQSSLTQRVYYQENENINTLHGVNDLAALNGQVYFSILGAQQLWKTSGGAQAVEIINISGPGCGPSCMPSISDLTATSRALVFQAKTSVTGTELWTSDGTAGGTRLLKDFIPGSQPTSIDFYPFFNSDPLMFLWDNTSSTYSLWKTDGTDAGTEKLLQFGNSEPGSANIRMFMGGYLLSYSLPATGYEPYLLYKGPFAITRQPMPTGMVAVNSTVDYKIEVSEWARALTQYQWMLNGSPITGAVGPELYILSVQYTDQGNYTCRVTYNDGSGDVTLISNPVPLQVVAKVPALSVPLMLLLSVLLCMVAGETFVRRRVV